MTSHALASGRDVAPSVVAASARVAQGELKTDADIAHAVKAHRRLQTLLAPTLPRTVLLMEQERKRVRGMKWVPSLGPTPLIRKLCLASGFFMALLVALSLLPEVNELSAGMFQDDGTTLLLNLAFIIAAAGLGGCFAGLFRASQEISRGTYDPWTESTYWIRIMLGLVAGLILAELVPEVLPILESSPEGTAGASDAGERQFHFARPVLALIGGFSATVVFKILQRMVDAVESIFSGDADERVRTEVTRATAKTHRTNAQLHKSVVSRLLELDHALRRGAASEDLSTQLHQVVEELVPGSAPLKEQSEAS